MGMFCLDALMLLFLTGNRAVSVIMATENIRLSVLFFQK